MVDQARTILQLHVPLFLSIFQLPHAALDVAAQHTAGGDGDGRDHEQQEEDGGNEGPTLRAAALGRPEGTGAINDVHVHGWITCGLRGRCVFFLGVFCLFCCG